MLVRCAVVLALVGPIGTAAADEPKAFTCSFDVGLARVYEHGQFVSEPAAPLAFGIGRRVRSFEPAAMLPAISSDGVMLLTV